MKPRLAIRVVAAVALALVTGGASCDPEGVDGFTESAAENIRTGATPALEDRRFTVMTYNIRMGYGTEDFGLSPFELRGAPQQLEPLIAAISAIDPDVVALQEVQGEAQARALAEALDMNFAYESHGTQSGTWWGLAILSKFEIVGAWKYQLSRVYGDPRVLLMATVEMHGQPVTIVSVHISHESDRVSMLRTTRNAILKMPEPAGPPILLGDLNTFYGDPALEKLWGMVDGATAVDTPSSRFLWERGTWIGEDHELWYWRIDYVYTDQNAYLVEDTGLIGETFWDASDHLAVFADLALN